VCVCVCVCVCVDGWMDSPLAAADAMRCGGRSVGGFHALHLEREGVSRRGWLTRSLCFPGLEGQEEEEGSPPPFDASLSTKQTGQPDSRTTKKKKKIPSAETSKYPDMSTSRRSRGRDVDGR
jgi:hypothetical protein